MAMKEKRTLLAFSGLLLISFVFALYVDKAPAVQPACKMHTCCFQQQVKSLIPWHFLTQPLYL